jgi:hypothetical protein
MPSLLSLDLITIAMLDYFDIKIIRNWILVR